MPTRHLDVGPKAAGQRLDAFLAGPLGSRSHAQRLIDAGLVRVQGAPRAKNHRVAAGERVEVSEPEPARPAPARPIDVPIVYEDDSVLVVDKPAALVVHPGATNPQPPSTGSDPSSPTDPQPPSTGSDPSSSTDPQPPSTGSDPSSQPPSTGSDPSLVELLAGRIAGGPDPQRPGVVHRLDRDTSGLLVLARTEEAYAALQRAMARREIEREYLALVEGVPPARSGLIDAPIGRDRRVRTRMSTDTDAPREARTRFEIERTFDDRAALLRVRLETGRTHQIRVHLAAIAHPVAGDPEYGHAGRFGLPRQFLHAARLAFAHPDSGERVELSSALPADLEEALGRL
jgi:23S rRNA pseudouridine1911/1915/1917 synthase